MAEEPSDAVENGAGSQVPQESSEKTSSGSSSSKTTSSPTSKSLGSTIVATNESPDGVRRSRRLSGEKDYPSDSPEEDVVAPPTLPKPKKAATARASTKPSTNPSNALDLNPKMLATLTNKNTQRNQQPFNMLDVQVVKMDCPRPPSPSSKVRSALDKEKEDVLKAREDRAKRRGQSKSEDDENEVESAPTSRKHARGAGDDEDYETPKRIRLAETEEPQEVAPIPQLELKAKRKKGGSKASSSLTSISSKERSMSRSTSAGLVPGKPNSKGKSVRWDRKLVFDFERGENVVVAFDARKSCLSKEAAVSSSAG